CDTSICRARSILCPVLNTSVDNDSNWNWIHYLPCWLHHLHRLHEQYGALQLRTHSQLGLLYFPPSQVPHVHSI
ncbi:hypothetical protein Godav_004703, partial [Gossypium davidsonii]|nr:hypothetical protein [Gossypium davidsonii]